MVRHLQTQENNAPDVSIFAGSDSYLGVFSQRVDAVQHLKFKCIAQVFIKFHLQKLSRRCLPLRVELPFLVHCELG